MATETLPGQTRVSRALGRLLSQARQESGILLSPRHRYIIFSDHHKGAGDEADDFRPSHASYLKALEAYDALGFTLIELGDCEELWENPIGEAMGTYPDIFQQSRKFYPDRYLRVVGNHDNKWDIAYNVKRYLYPIFPDIAIHRCLLFRYQDTPETSGEIFLAHGHQGTLDADIFGFIPPLVLPIYRWIQNFTGIGHTSPSKDACLRGQHDTIMYRWASEQGKLLLIAGHTHRPVWSSRTHLEKLLMQYDSLLSLPPEQRPADFDKLVTDLKAAIEKREAEYPPCNDTIKTRPCYFNTGCCRFKDGDITGIELEDGELRLVKWGMVDNAIQRIELEKAPLADFFGNL
jgi:hypothetical protein